MTIKKAVEKMKKGASKFSEGVYGVKIDTKGGKKDGKFYKVRKQSKR